MKKFGIFLICAVLLISVALVSCAENKPQDTTAPQQETTTEAPDTETADTTEAPVYDVNVVEGGVSQYKIIRSANASQEIVDASVKLKDAFSSSYGVDLSLSGDIKTATEENYEYEILIGSVKRDEYNGVDTLLNYNDTIITVVDNKIIISGGNDDAVVKAVDYFIENYIKTGELVIKSNVKDIQKGVYTPITLDGVPLEEYTIAYDTGYRDAIKRLTYLIGSTYGIKLNTVKDTTSTADREIVIGSLSKTGTFGGIGVDDFRVEIRDNDVYIYGGSKKATETACKRFFDALSKNSSLALADVAVTYTLPDRQVYINDISKFALDWELYHDTPEWMLDFDEKLAAFYDPDGRMMSVVHRCTTTNYPENSVEAIISCIMLGIDYVEIDIRETKDGKLVLMHDAKLTRMTDVADKKGKNGLPNSENVEDWTYDQLMQLNLRAGNGGSTVVTPYKIATFEEILKIVANRIFILTDVKPTSTEARCMSYVDDMWPLIEKYDAYLSIPFFWWEDLTKNNYAITKQYFKIIEEKTGKKPGVILAKSNYNELYAFNHFFGFSMVAKLGSDFATYSYKTYFEEYGSVYKDLKGKVRIFTFAYNGAGSPFPENKESFEFYSALLEHGVNLPMVEKGFLMAQYIAENCQPTEYKR